MKNETLNPIKISISGEERFDFIQNLITNDLNKIDKTLYSYLLTPQGKILYEVQIQKLNESYDILCTNDQLNLFEYLDKYSKLSEISLKKLSIDSMSFGKNYLLNLFKDGKIDSNFLKHSNYLPSEINDEYVDYKKGCYVGQEVVSRIKHRQLKKKNIRVFEKISQDINPLPTDFQLLMELDKYKVLRLSIDTNYEAIQNNFGIKLINL
tara:strand:- start:800 stop:1426 length:627 start_codon:yes stop_codon:yes gene_type:complete